MTKIYLCGLKNETLELEMKYKININKNMLYNNIYNCYIIIHTNAIGWIIQK